MRHVAAALDVNENMQKRKREKILLWQVTELIYFRAHT